MSIRKNLLSLVAATAIATGTNAQSIDEKIEAPGKVSDISFTLNEPYNLATVVDKAMQNDYQLQIRVRVYGIDIQNRSGPTSIWSSMYPTEVGQITPPSTEVNASWNHPTEGSWVFRYALEFQVRDTDTGEWINMSMEVPLYNPNSEDADFGISEIPFSNYNPETGYPSETHRVGLWIPYTGSEVLPAEVPGRGSITQPPEDDSGQDEPSEDIEQKLRVSNNPFDNSGISLSGDSLTGNKSFNNLNFEVYSIDGKRVFQQPINSDSNQVSWVPNSSTPAGVYILSINNGEKQLFGFKATYLK